MSVLHLTPQLRPLTVVVTASLVVPAIASAATEQEQQELNQLRFEVKQLRLINERQAETLKQFETRLNRFEGQQADAQPRQLTDTGQAPSTRAMTQPDTRQEATPSKSVENILSEEHALFGSGWTIETGLTYTHYDRKQLVLDGFLALDAIFLGNIAIDDVESDILTLDIGARYNVNNRWQLAVNTPFVSRYSAFQKSSTVGPATVTTEETVDETLKLGDIELASYYQLHAETATIPDLVWSLKLKAPTGRHPYGIDQRTSASDAALQFPSELPTGSGLWSLGTGLSLVKTIDPAILFANIEYTHQFANGFDDINGNPGIVEPGDVRLGNSFQYGLGMAFALNDRMSLSFSYSQRIQQKAETRLAGSGWSDVVGSDANAATFNTGVTYSLSDRLSMSTNLSIGLTPDAPDFSIGLKLPYSL